MSVTVCLSANAMGYPGGGGHFWVFLNWALGLRARACRVIWLETVRAGAAVHRVRENLEILRSRLALYGLAESVALASTGPEPLDPELAHAALDLGAAAEADLLLNLHYGTPAAVVARFRRTALVDIDPGLLQLWMSGDNFRVPPHDLYFTTGETVGRPGSRFPDCGIAWIYAPPCVALDYWPVAGAPAGSPYTTVSHWTMGEWVVDGKDYYPNDKRLGFLPFLDLPGRTSAPLELALFLVRGEEEEIATLRARGWSVRYSSEVAASPAQYRSYIQSSRGEFSCVKPSCIRLQNAWISDRTLCYLASGKPAVVQHTGPSRFLPDREGLLRFHDLGQAAAMLDECEADYDRHARAARALVEEHFAARTVAGAVLERALN